MTDQLETLRAAYRFISQPLIMSKPKDAPATATYRLSAGQYNALTAQLRAAITDAESRASRSPAAGVEGIAEGWRVVPVELTFDMLDAVTASPCFDIACLGEDVARDLWNTFLGAAPASPLADTPADIETLRRVAAWIARDVPAGTTSATHMLGVVQAALSAAPPPPSSADHVPGVGNMVQSETRSPDGSAPSAEARAVEFGGYLATAATRLLEFLNEASIFLDVSLTTEQADGLADYRRGLRSAIYEFQKRVARIPEPPALDDGAGNGGAG